MNVKVVSGQIFSAYKINFLDFYNELKNIEVPQAFIEYTEIMNRPHKEICIENFHTNPSKKGYGTKAMVEVIKIANKFNIVLSLKPTTDSGKDYVSTFWRKLDFKKGTKDFDDGYYLKYYDGYIEQDNSIKKEYKETFLTKIKRFLNLTK